VEAFQISGPLFFAVANRLNALLDQFPTPPSTFILRMRLVPLIAASGVTALQQFLTRCEGRGTRVILSGLRAQPRRVLERMELVPDGRQLRFADNFAQAIVQSRSDIAARAAI